MQTVNFCRRKIGSFFTHLARVSDSLLGGGSQREGEEGEEGESLRQLYLLACT